MLSARIRNNHLKMKALMCSHHSPIIGVWEFFQMFKGSFPGRLWSDLAELKTHPRLYECPCYPQECRRSNRNMLECSQHYALIFRRLRAAYSVIGDWIWQKCKLIQAVMDILVTCKNAEDPFKNERTRVLIAFIPL